MSTCIYCRRTDAALSREHVMPTAFGMFENNLVLGEEVCHDCNQALGRDVETPAARGSLEGVHRFLSDRPRPLSSFLKTPRNRVSFEIDEPGWEGVQAYHLASPDGTQPLVMFAPQVVVDLKNGGHRAYKLDELTHAKLKKDNVRRYRLYALTDDEVDQLIEGLATCGIYFKNEGAIPSPKAEDGKVRVKYAAVYDVIVRRLMAKIAFNYMTHRLGAAFALKPEFDAIRVFIRQGVEIEPGLAEVDPKPLLFQEQNAHNWHLTDAHLVAVDRASPDGLLGHVSLFNLLHHRIVLARRNPEIMQTSAIPSGHLFAWRAGQIDPLQGWDEENLVQPAEVVLRHFQGKR